MLFVVMVFVPEVAAIVICPECDHVIPAVPPDKLRFPNTCIVLLPAIVTFPTSGAPTVRFEQLAVAVTVTVYAVALESVSRSTVSDDVGTEAPPAPPEVAAQFVVVLASQLPVPPTQNLVAILVLLRL